MLLILIQPTVQNSEIVTWKEEKRYKTCNGGNAVQITTRNEHTVPNIIISNDSDKMMHYLIANEESGLFISAFNVASSRIRSCGRPMWSTGFSLET